MDRWIGRYIEMVRYTIVTKSTWHGCCNTCLLFVWTLQGDPLYAKPTPGGQDDTHTYTDLTVYEPVGSQGRPTVKVQRTGTQLS